MSAIVELISNLLLLLGSFFVVTGIAGLFRFPDFFTRMHAVSITDTLGAICILVGLMLHSDSEWLVIMKLLFILLFSLLTGPAASHALAKSALHRKQKPLLGDDINTSTNSGD